MKKAIRKVLLLMLTISIMLGALKTSAYASTYKIVHPDDFGEPISESSYIDDEGNLVEEKIYFIPTGNCSLRDASGEGWYKNEKKHTFSAGHVMVYYAEGYFTWGNGNVSVTNPYATVNSVPGITYSNISFDYGQGQYLGFLNNYAYVSYSFTATTYAGLSHDYSVRIRVSQSGNVI